MPVVAAPEVVGSSEPGLAVGEAAPIVIGLVNNMSDAALRTTEQQYRALLSTTSNGQPVRLRSFFLPEIPRSDLARQTFMRHYEPIDLLWDSQLDGLIVTGAEPTEQFLTDEPYWNTLTRLVDWARDHTTSSIWSCLAAHATVLHLDNIDRRALDRKLSGIFECRKVADHPILAGVPPQWHVPHSRWNGLPEDLLVSTGYRILSVSAEAGADVFVREQGSLFVFLNGHPEYYADALFREFRRDVVRFLSGEMISYPELPQAYFDEATSVMLEAFRQRAVQSRTRELATELPIRGFADERLPQAWQVVASQIFTNWLDYLVTHKLITHKSGHAITQ